MRKSLVLLCLSVLVSPSAYAGIVLNYKTPDGTATDIFNSGKYYNLENGVVESFVDQKKNHCVFYDHEKNVAMAGNCDDMGKQLDTAAENMFQGISDEQKNMMKQFQGMQKSSGSVSVSKIGDQTIAGYLSACSNVGSQRTVCTSKKLQKEVEAEFDSKRMKSIMDKALGSSQERMGGQKDPTAEAIAKLSRDGYVTKDVTRGSIPGMNSAIMAMLPESQREQILKSTGGGGPEEGETLVSVEKKNKTPKLPDYPEVSPQEYMQQQMGGR